jgi:hypothetical protein
MGEEYERLASDADGLGEFSDHDSLFIFAGGHSRL